MPLRAICPLVGTVLLVCLSAFGAGSASADSLCEVAESPCAAESAYTIPIVFEGHSNEVVLASGSFKVTCESDAMGEATADLGSGEGISADVRELTFSGCAGTCTTVAEAGLPYNAFAEATGGGNGTGSASEGSGGGVPRITLSSCSLGITCIFGASSVPGSLAGAELGSVEIETTLERRTGSSTFCPTSGTFTGTYTANREEPTFIEEAP